MIYLLITLLLICLCYIESIIISRQFSHISLIGICIALVFFAGLRYEVGTDWAAYYELYHETTDRVEIGYATLNNLFSTLSIPFNVFLLFVNGISLTLMYFFLRKHTALMVLGALILFSDLYLYYNFSGIRQAVAISITCFSISYAINRNFIKFGLLILLAACFHLSAIAFIVVYFIPRSNLSFRHIVISCLGFLFIALFLNFISDWITLYTLKNADYYVNLQDRSENLMGLFFIGILKRSVIIILVLALGHYRDAPQNFKYFFNIYLFGFAIFLSSYMISPDIGVRLSSYFTIFDIILAGNLALLVKSRSLRLIIVSIFVLFALYKVFGYMGDEYFAYDSILKFM